MWQDRNKVTLTMDDLSLALGEHGVNVRKPDYCESSQRNEKLMLTIRLIVPAPIITVSLYSVVPCINSPHRIYRMNDIIR